MPLNPFFLHLAGISMAAALLCAVSSRRASLDVRLWLAIALVASMLSVSA